MTERTPLTLEEHQQLSQHWHVIRKELTAMFKIVNGRLPKSFVRRFFTMHGPLENNLECLRDKLENIMYQDVGKDRGANIHIYYGNNPHARQPVTHGPNTLQ